MLQTIYVIELVINWHAKCFSGGPGSETILVMKKLMIFAVLAAFTFLCRPAQAIVIEVGTNTYEGITDGSMNPSYLLTIDYEVDFSSSSDLYTYDYILSTAPAESLYSFAIGGQPDPINTSGLVIVNYGGAVVGASGATGNSVVWGWGVSSAITSTTVSFTSPIGPEPATFTANDDDIAWSAPALIPAPVPEPSFFALLTGIVFVCGLFRYRKAVSLKPKACPQKSPPRVQ